MLRISGIKLPVGFTGEDVSSAVAAFLGVQAGALKEIVPHKLSLDARHKSDICHVASFDVKIDGESRFLKRPGVEPARLYEYEYPPVSKLKKRPIVVGAGPAGLFAALILSCCGARPILIERGEAIDGRKKTVDAFWRGGELRENSNVQFGEGGAGAFSDGKLTTGTRDSRHRKILEELCAAGAPESIKYLAKPHIGSDRLVETVKNLRGKIISLGGEVRFNCRLDDILIKNGALAGVRAGGEDIDADVCVLAIGHSARDTFEMLWQKGVRMEKKPFAVGFRIEHLQNSINAAQHGLRADALPAADYKLAIRLPGGKTVYTFCMCPGGSVVAAASEGGGVVTNGMSLFARDGKNANSAVLATVFPEDIPGSSPLAGFAFQRELERRAFALGGGGFHAPAQLAGDFIRGVPSKSLGAVEPTYLPGVALCDISEIFPKALTEVLRAGLKQMDIRIRNFCREGALLTAPESRSSSPVRIVRDLNMASSVKGLFPCGEGAGYAGGIMSAATDGIKAAEEILRQINGNLA